MIYALSKYAQRGILVAKIRSYGDRTRAQVEIRRVRQMWILESRACRLLAMEAYLSAYLEAVHQNRLQRQAYLKSFRRFLKTFWACERPLFKE